MAKKILALFVVVIIAGIGFLWFLGGKIKTPSATPNQTASTITGLPTPTKRPIEDVNQNGKPDWTEALLGSKPSTPNESAVALVNQAIESKSAPLLPLETFSTQPLTTYQTSDLNLSADKSETAITAYASRVKQILAIYSTTGFGTEISLVLNVAEKGDQSSIAKLNETVRRYQLSVSELLALEVPANASLLHLNLINNLSHLAEGAALMSQIKSEPVMALSAAQMQTSRIKPTLAAIGNLNIFFSAYNLTS